MSLGSGKSDAKKEYQGVGRHLGWNGAGHVQDDVGAGSEIARREFFLHDRQKPPKYFRFLQFLLLYVFLYVIDLCSYCILQLCYSLVFQKLNMVLRHGQGGRFNCVRRAYQSFGEGRRQGERAGEKTADAAETQEQGSLPAVPSGNAQTVPVSRFLCQMFATET